MFFKVKRKKYTIVWLSNQFKPPQSWPICLDVRLHTKILMRITYLAFLQTKLPLTFFLVSKIFSTLLNLTTSSKLALELIYNAQERS